MDISYKFVLDKRRVKKDCIYPLKLRIFQYGKTKEQTTGIHLHEKDWDEKLQIIRLSDKDYKQKSYSLGLLKTKINKQLLLHEDSEDSLSPDMLLNKLNKHPKKEADTLLSMYGERLISSLKTANKAGTALAYRDAVNSLIRYAGKNLLIKGVTYRLLDDYNTAMLAKGIKVNSIAAYLRSIRAIYNRAIKEGLADIANYPFNRFKIETEDTFSRTLTIAEMQQFFRVELPYNSPAWHNRNYFMLSFCLIGINYTDLFTLTPNDVRDNVVNYRRDKTGKLYSIGIPDPAQKLFAYYANYKSSNNHIYLLPELKPTADSMVQKNWIKQITKTNNKYLKQVAGQCTINKNVTTYYARYTWANIARQLGYSKDMIAEALGHEYGNQVTGIYLDSYDRAVIDEMNKRIIAKVLKLKI